MNPNLGGYPTSPTLVLALMLVSATFSLSQAVAEATAYLTLNDSSQLLYNYSTKLSCKELYKVE